jgi:hypothetical protein
MVATFKFPEEESEFYSILTFRKYQRMRPNQPLNPSFEGMIRLPLPQSLIDSFGINVNDTVLDILGNAGSDVLAAGQTKMEGYANEIKSGKGAIQFLKDSALEILAVTPGISDTSASGSTRAGQLGQLETGLIRNPHLTTLFDGVRLKTYTFTWKLAPRSEAEARQLESIINYIKAYMHPEINPNSGGFALDYPYLASLEFAVGENKIVPNVNVAFITALQINNSGSGVPAFFKDGKSVSIEMSISFQEINIKTRGDFLNPRQVMGPFMNNNNNRRTE